MASIPLNPPCPKCQQPVSGVFPSACPDCGFTIDAIAGRGTTDFQIKKAGQHSDLLYGRSIGLYGKVLNASFDFYGQANIDALVRFAITYGDRATLPSSRGGHQNPIIVSYIPEIIGSGITMYSQDTIPCSGICIISAHSLEWGHSFPILDQWMKVNFQGAKSNCKLCGAPTSFAEPVCNNCYQSNGNWINLL